MYDELIFGRQFFKPYIVSDSDLNSLRRKFRGKETKVLALVVSVQNEGKLTQQQIADIAGVTRMTLFRWRTTDRVFQREHERLSNKAYKHWSNEARKRGRRNRPSVTEILSDHNLYRTMLGL